MLSPKTSTVLRKARSFFLLGLFLFGGLAGPASAQVPQVTPPLQLGDLTVEDGHASAAVDQAPLDCIRVATTASVNWLVKDLAQPGQVPEGQTALFEVLVYHDNRIVDIAHHTVVWNEHPFVKASTDSSEPRIVLDPPPRGVSMSVALAASYWNGPLAGPATSTDTATLEFDCLDDEPVSPVDLVCGLQVPQPIPLPDACDRLCEALDAAARAGIIPTDAGEQAQLAETGSLCSKPCRPGDPGCVDPCPTGDCGTCQSHECPYQREAVRGNLEYDSADLSVGVRDDVGLSGITLKPGTVCADGSEESRGGSVNHVTGEFTARITPLRVVTGRGPNVQFDLTYRSQSPAATHGAFGFRWDFTYGKHLVHDPVTRDVTRYDGEGVREVYRYDAATGGYVSPVSYYDRLEVDRQGEGIKSMRIVDRYGTVETYRPDGRLLAITDRNENALRFAYDGLGRLTQVIDAHGRPVHLTYDASGRVEAIRDFTGRMARFSYNAANTLAAVTMPGGATQSFTYSGSYQMLSVADGKGMVYLRNAYDGFNRVERQDQGLGSTSYAYNPAAGDTYVSDPNGNLVRYRYDSRGLVTQKTVYTNRDINPDDPPTFTTNYTFNAYLERVRVDYPDGATHLYVYDTQNPDPLARGNLLAKIERSALPPERGGWPERTWSYTYEPLFNQLKTDTPPNGNAKGYVPPNGGNNTQPRYDTVRIYDHEEPALGDVNGDGTTAQKHGNVVKIVYPVANAAGAPHPAISAAYTGQAAYELFTYNHRGQLLTHTNAAGLVEKREYHPPGHKNEGYLARVIRDYGNGTDPLTGKPHRNEATNATRDDLGNLVAIKDHAGNSVQFGVDEGCRVTSMRSGAAIAPTNVTWDANNQVVSMEQQANGSLPAKADFVYDVAGNLVRESTNATRPPGAPATEAPTRIVKEYGYDRKGNLVYVRSPNAVSGVQPADVESMVYDERNLLYSKTRGGVTGQFVSLAANSLVSVPASLVDRPQMATANHTYDGGGRLVRAVDPNGHATEHRYDGFGRQVARIDALGNVFTTSYDPNGNVVRTSVWENATSDGTILCADTLNAILELALGTGAPQLECLKDPRHRQYRLLEHTRQSHDERDREYRSDRRIFDPSTGRCLEDGPLTPGDCHVTQLVEYSPSSKPTRVTDDNNHTSRRTYDREDRLLTSVDPLGNTITQSYDKAGNVIQVDRREVDPRGLLDPRVFTSKSTYDALNRLVNSTNDLRHTTMREYDPFGNAAVTRDANGQYVQAMHDLAGRLIQKSHVMRTGDNGLHVFQAAFATPGPQTLTVQDTHHAAMARASDEINVIGPAVRYTLEAPATVQRNTPFEVVVRARDLVNNTNDRYVGAFELLSTDDRASFPSGLAFAAADQGRKAVQATLQRPGLHNILAFGDDGLVGAVAVNVLPGPIEALQVLLPGESPAPGPGSGRAGSPRPQLAGIPFAVTVRAVDDEWNTVPVDAPVTLSSSDPQATLGQGSLVAGEGTFQAVLLGPGDPTITAQHGDPAVDAGTTSGLTLFVPGWVDVAAPASVRAGTPATLALSVRRADGTLLSDYAGTVALQASDPAATLPAQVAFTPADGGTKQVQATFATPGEHVVLASDPQNPFLSGRSDPVQVTGTAVAFSVSAPATATSDVAFTVQLTARDAAGNRDAAYAGTVAFGSTDAAALLPGATAFTPADQGSRSFTVTMRTAGSQWLLVQDAASGASATIAVQVAPGPVAKLQVLLPGEVAAPGTATGKLGAPFDQQAHAPFDVVVNSVDAHWNVVATTHTVSLGGSDLSAPPPAPLVAGTLTRTVTIGAGGPHTITATDVTVPSVASGTSAAVAVEAPAEFLDLTAPASVLAGTTFSVGMVARTATGGTRPSYNAFVAFESSDPAAVLPGTTLVSQPTHSFSVRLNTPGLHAILAYDGEGAYGLAYVRAVGPASSFELQAPTQQASGTAFTFAATALDNDLQRATGYRGTVRVLSSDPMATLPPNQAYTAADQGRREFTATLRTPGHHYVAVVDAQSSSIYGLAYVTVVPGAPARLQLVLPGEQGAPFTPTGKVGAPVPLPAHRPFMARVDLVDSHGNRVPAAASVALGSDAGVSLPSPFPLSEGTALVPVSASPGLHTLTATSAGGPSVAAGAATFKSANGQYLQLSHAPATPAGAATAVTVTARNPDGTVMAGYRGLVALHVSDGAGVSTLTHAFGAADAGQHTFTVTLQEPGTASLFAEEAEGFLLPATGEVEASGPAFAFSAAAPAQAVSMVPVQLTLTAEDLDGRRATGHAGEVALTSSDKAAILPGPTSFTGADQGRRSFTVTLATPGIQSVTVKDTADPGLAITLFVTVQPGPPAHLQVLLPGEKAAPGTATGKTGAPLAVPAGVPFTVRVRATDANWNLVPEAGTVDLSASAAGATLPAAATLAAGTASFQASFPAAGSWTLSASRAAVPALSGTSAAVAVGPAAHHFALTAPAVAHAYDPVNVTVEARDPDLERNVTYTEVVRFSGSDPLGLVPTWYLYTMGLDRPGKHGEVIGYVNVTYEHDANSRLVAQSDANGARTRYFYNELGHMIREQYADGTFATFGHDKLGNIVLRRDPNGNEARVTFDPLGRPVRVEVTRAAATVGTDTQEFRHDALGRMTYARDGNRTDPAANHTVEKRYDSLGRVLEETQDGRSTLSAYDGLGNRLQVTYPSGRSVNYTYDALNRVAQVRDHAGALVAEYHYQGPSRVVERTTGNGVATGYAYDAAGRLTGLEHAKDGSVVAGFTYKLTPTDDLFTAQRLHLAGLSEAYELDSLRRVNELERGPLDAKRNRVTAPASGLPSRQTWSLDGAHNWRNTTVTTDGVAVAQDRSHNNLNQLVQERIAGVNRTFRYDPNGNLVDDGLRTYTWDFANRLREVRRTDGTLVAVYEYDALNRRVAKTTHEAAQPAFVRYYLDGQKEVEEWDGKLLDQGTKVHYVHGPGLDEVILMDRVVTPPPGTIQAATQPLTGLPAGQAVQDTACALPGAGCTKPVQTRLYLHQDRLLSVHAVTDEAGVVREGYLYDAYGRQTVVRPGAAGEVTWGADDVVLPGGTSAVGNALMFTGRRLDAETGLLQYRARYYDAHAGRFISRDPLGLWKDSANLGNGYGYVGNNPLNDADPTGMWSLGGLINRVANTVSNVARQVVQAVSTVARSVVSTIRGFASTVTSAFSAGAVAGASAGRTFGSASSSSDRHGSGVTQNRLNQVSNIASSAFNYVSPVKIPQGVIGIIGLPWSPPFNPPLPPLPMPPLRPVRDLLEKAPKIGHALKEGAKQAWSGLGRAVHGGLDVLEKWDPTIEVSGMLAFGMGGGAGCGVSIYRGFYCQGTSGLGIGAGAGAELSFGGPMCGKRTTSVDLSLGPATGTARVENNGESASVSLGWGVGTPVAGMVGDTHHTPCTGGLGSNLRRVADFFWKR